MMLAWMIDIFMFSLQFIERIKTNLNSCDWYRYQNSLYNTRKIVTATPSREVSQELVTMWLGLGDQMSIVFKGEPVPIE